MPCKSFPLYSSKHETIFPACPSISRSLSLARWSSPRPKAAILQPTAASPRSSWQSPSPLFSLLFYCWHVFSHYIFWKHFAIKWQSFQAALELSSGERSDHFPSSPLTCSLPSKQPSKIIQMHARNPQLAYMKNPSLSVHGRVYIALFIKRGTGAGRIPVGALCILSWLSRVLPLQPQPVPPFLLLHLKLSAPRSSSCLLLCNHFALAVNLRVRWTVLQKCLSSCINPKGSWND